MKNAIKKLFISIITLTLVLVMSGCSIYLNSNTNLPDSKDLAGNVVFNTQTTTTPTTIQQAANMVKRSVVKIAMQQNGSTVSEASGVIVDIQNENRKSNEYYIVTAHHVINDPVDIVVYVPDEDCRNNGDDNYDTEYVFKGIIGGDRKTQLEVSLIGGDRESDVAVLKLDIGSKDVDICQSVVAPSTEKVEYAEEVFAIGNPSGELPMTFLKGDISYIDRVAYISDVGYLTLIQHSCLITHGSSGGGLFNAKGQLIGITNAGSDTYKGMNYAVPFYGESGFVNVVSQLMATYYNNPNNYGYVSGRWNLGVTVETANTSVNGSYIRVKSIDENGHCTALNAGDFITKLSYGQNESVKFNVTSIESFSKAVMNARRDLKIGDSLVLTYQRPDMFGRKYTEGTIRITLTKQLIFCDTGR